MLTAEEEKIVSQLYLELYNRQRFDASQTIMGATGNLNGLESGVKLMGNVLFI